MHCRYLHCQRKYAVALSNKNLSYWPLYKNLSYWPLVIPAISWHLDTSLQIIEFIVSYFSLRLSLDLRTTVYFIYCINKHTTNLQVTDHELSEKSLSIAARACRCACRSKRSLVIRPLRRVSPLPNSSSPPQTPTHRPVGPRRQPLQ